MNNTHEIGFVGLWKKGKPNPEPNDSSTDKSAQPDAGGSGTTNFNHRYWAYQNWCEQIGVPSATFTDWERINRQVAEDSFTFPPGKSRTMRVRAARENEDSSLIA
jgi:hypothetical protein